MVERSEEGSERAAARTVLHPAALKMLVAGTGSGRGLERRRGRAGRVGGVASLVAAYGDEGLSEPIKPSSDLPRRRQAGQRETFNATKKTRTFIYFMIYIKYK